MSSLMLNYPKESIFDIDLDKIKQKYNLYTETLSFPCVKNTDKTLVDIEKSYEMLPKWKRKSYWKKFVKINL